MGSIRYAIKMLKVDKKQCIFYISSMIFSIAIVFNVFNIMFNEDFVSRSDQRSYYTFSAIALLVIVVAMLFVAFANLYFIYGKTKELAIAVLSGRSVYTVGGILAIQNVILGVIGVAIGGILGVFLIPVVNTFAYTNAEKVVKSFKISGTGSMLMTIVIIMIFIIMVLVDIGYVYRREIIELVSEKNKNNEKEGVGIGFHLFGSTNVGFSFKLPKFLYPFLFILPVVILFLTNLDYMKRATIMPYAIFVSIIGMMGMISFTIPKGVFYLKKKVFTSNKFKVQSLSIFTYLLRKTNLLLVILLASILYISLIICKNGEYLNIRSVAMIVYIVVTCIISVTIIYKIFIEAINIDNHFKQINLLGYIKKDITKIIRETIIYYYTLIMFLPLVPVICIESIYIKLGTMSQEIFINLIMIHLLINIISAVISYVGFRSIILRSLNKSKK